MRSGKDLKAFDHAEEARRHDPHDHYLWSLLWRRSVLMCVRHQKKILEHVCCLVQVNETVKVYNEGMVGIYEGQN